MKGVARGVSAMGTLVGVIVILIGLGIIWFATGGPQRTGEHEQPFFSTLPWPFASKSGTSTAPIINVGGFSPSTGQGGSGTGSGGGGTGTATPTPPKTVTSRFGLGTLVLDSPYAGKIIFAGAGVGETDPKKEYVSLQTMPGVDRTITITGWTLAGGATGLTLKIGQGVSLPFLGQVNAEGPITVGGESTVYIVSGRSPNGISFRLNRCTGYFEQFQDFVPRLPKKCPTQSQEFNRLYSSNLSSFNDACINFLNQIGQCIFVVNAPVTNIGSECQNFALNTLSYNGCINAHKNTPGFYQNEWRVFLNRGEEIWKNRDEIRLLDENGKLVDVLSY